MIEKALRKIRELIQDQRFKAYQRSGKPIPFKFRNREYYLNPDQSAIYHIRNSTSKIARMCDSILVPPQIVFDVGANCGLFSAFISERFPDCRTFAFEPSLDLIPLIKLNCDLSKVTVCDYAIGAKDGKEKLFIYPGAQQANSLNKKAVTPFASEDAIKELIVPCRSLDSVALEHGIRTIDILKVDVQGFEGDVFLGAKNILQNVRYLFVESSWLDIESITGLIPFAIHYGFTYAAVLSPVYMGADIMFSKEPIPPIGAALFFALDKDLLKSRWI